MIALDGIRVASPCHVSWDSMAGDERTRFCGSCRMNVFNIESLDREAALALVERAQGGDRVCVRFYRRADGTVMTGDCPVGLKLLRRKVFQFLVRAAAVLLLALGTLAGVGLVARGSRVRHVPPLAKIVEWLDPEPQHVAGMIACPPPQGPVVIQPAKPVGGP